MISDLAPIDLILQRLGREHRHPRPWRPGPVAGLRLILAVDEAEDLPTFGSDDFVYEPYVLLRSFLALQGRKTLTLPADTPDLIRTVYEDCETSGLSREWAERLVEARRRMMSDEDKQVFEARKRLVPLPGEEGLLGRANAGLEEDAPGVHAAFQALTRLGRPSISVVCLHATTNGVSTEPDGSGQCVSLDQAPDNALTGDLSRHTISLSHRAVFDHYLRQDIPTGWREHPLLRDHRAAVFDHDLCPLPGTPYTLRLTRELGLEILKD